MKLDNQTAFDRVYQHLVDQGRQAYVRHVGCKYRTENGLKCAIGALIPDELYSPKLEGGTLRDIIRFPEIKELFSGVDIDLLGQLQITHDVKNATWSSAGFVGHRRMKALAEQFNLTYTKPEKTQ